MCRWPNNGDSSGSLEILCNIFLSSCCEPLSSSGWVLFHSFSGSHMSVYHILLFFLINAYTVKTIDVGFDCQAHYQIKNVLIAEPWAELSLFQKQKSKERKKREGERGKEKIYRVIKSLQNQTIVFLGEDLSVNTLHYTNGRGDYCTKHSEFPYHKGIISH